MMYVHVFYNCCGRCGKTTLCQLLMKFLRQKLYIMNCHMHTEAADFLGGLRPVRNRSEDNEVNKVLITTSCNRVGHVHY